MRIIDLTQPMMNGMPVMEGITPPAFRDLASVAADGYCMSEYAFVNHTGIPQVFSVTTPRVGSPYVGIGVSVALTLILGATLGRHYGVLTYFALMATTGSLGILFVYILVALGGMVFFWRVRATEPYNWLLDVVLPLVAVAICGYAIYASIFPRPPAPVSYSLWIALAFLAAGLLVVAGLVFIRPERVRSFGQAFETTGRLPS